MTEAKFLRRIRDRRVVHVYDIGTLDDGRPFFVMDYLDAGSLEDLRRSGVAPAEALRLCAEAARGLEVLHRHHLVHRDVTPGNLLLTSRPDGSLRRRGRRSRGGPFGGGLVRRRDGRRHAVVHGPRAGGRRGGRRSGRRLCAVRGGVRAAQRRAAVPGADHRRPDGPSGRRRTGSAGRPTRSSGHPRRALPLGLGHRPAPTTTECQSCWPMRSTSSPTSWSAFQAAPARQAAHFRADYATKPRRLFRSRPECTVNPVRGALLVVLRRDDRAGGPGLRRLPGHRHRGQPVGLRQAVRHPSCG